jgi:hypothetical protein
MDRDERRIRPLAGQRVESGQHPLAVRAPDRPEEQDGTLAAQLARRDAAGLRHARQRERRRRGPGGEQRRLAHARAEHGDEQERRRHQQQVLQVADAAHR